MSVRCTSPPRILIIRRQRRIRLRPRLTLSYCTSCEPQRLFSVNQRRLATCFNRVCNACCLCAKDVIVAVAIDDTRLRKTRAQDSGGGIRTRPNVAQVSLQPDARAPLSAAILTGSFVPRGESFASAFQFGLKKRLRCKSLGAEPPTRHGRHSGSPPDNRICPPARSK